MLRNKLTAFHNRFNVLLTNLKHLKSCVFKRSKFQKIKLETKPIKLPIRKPLAQVDTVL
jgi:hypothetical protein